MSYRFRLYEYNKDLVDELQRCKTYDDVYYTLTEEERENCEEPEELYLFELGSELFDLGSNFDDASVVIANGEPLFKTEELQEHFEHFKPVIVRKEELLYIIERYKQKIVDLYKDLLEDPDQKVQYGKMLQHTKHRFAEWNTLRVINTYENEESLCNSWIYEYVIFDLVRIYKSFDWKNKRMIFMGW